MECGAYFNFGMDSVTFESFTNHTSFQLAVKLIPSKYIIELGTPVIDTMVNSISRIPKSGV